MPARRRGGRAAPRMFKGTFQAFSIEVVGHHGSYGDKIYLPQNVFQEVTVLYRLEFPLFFKLTNRFGQIIDVEQDDREEEEDEIPTVYCGVREFSAPEGVCYIPRHIMANLNIEEGSRVHVDSVKIDSTATWVQFEAKNQGLIDMLQTLGGPKYFLENKLLEYSVLFAGQCLVIEHDGKEYTLRVVQCKPDRVNSIVGSMDLEVEFKSITTKEFGMNQEDEEEEEDELKKALALSMSLSLDGKSGLLDVSGDMGWSLHSSRDIKHNHSSSPLRSNNNNNNNNNNLSSPRIKGGGLLREQKQQQQQQQQDQLHQNDPTKTKCSNCDLYIPNTSFEMHELRCARMVFRCEVCRKPVATRERESHAGTHANVRCSLGCDAVLPQDEMQIHERRDCEFILSPCRWCGGSKARRELQRHEDACGEEFVSCDVCLSSTVQRSSLVSGLHEREQCAPRCKLGCGRAILLRDQLLHEAGECVNRLVECEYCNQFLKFNTFNKHQDYCGSRTEQCELCTRWITRRDMAVHVASDCQLPLVVEKAPVEAPFPLHLLSGADLAFNRQTFKEEGDEPDLRDDHSSLFRNRGQFEEHSTGRPFLSSDEEMAAKLQAETYYADFLSERAKEEEENRKQKQKQPYQRLGYKPTVGPRARAKLASSSSSSVASGVEGRLAAARKRREQLSLQKSALDGKLSSSLRRGKQTTTSTTKSAPRAMRGSRVRGETSLSSGKPSISKTTTSSRIGRRGENRMPSSSSSCSSSSASSSLSAATAAAVRRRDINASVTQRRQLLDAMMNDSKENEPFVSPADADALDLMLQGRPLSRSRQERKIPTSSSSSSSSSSASSSKSLTPVKNRAYASAFTSASVSRRQNQSPPSSSSSSSVSTSVSARRRNPPRRARNNKPPARGWQ